LKLGGCLANHLRSFLKQSSPPLDQNFALFKIHLNFGRIHQTLLSPYSFSLLALQLDQGKDPSWLPLPLPLISLTPSPSLCPVAPGHKEWEEPEKILVEIFSTSFSLPPLPSSTPNRRSASPLHHLPDPSVQRDPAPTSPRPLSPTGITREHGHYPEASRGSHRPALRHQTPLSTSQLAQSSAATHAIHWPPPSPALALSPASRERPERAPRSQPRKDGSVSCNARTCTASYPLHPAPPHLSRSRPERRKRARQAVHTI
jgi:hypothetical protein